MAFQLGSIIDGYQFLDILDSTRAEVCYRIRNHNENRIEQLRVLSKALQDDPEHFERFLRESRVHSRLVHPNILCFYNAFVLDGSPVITTEYVEGATLAARLEVTRLPVGKACQYVMEILAALTRAHELGIVHKGVAPENILITHKDTIKLTGFTYARSAADPRLTKVGISLGDVHYLSPEQVKGALSIDHRADIYACGVVLYQLLVGQRPFESMSQFEIMAAQVGTPPRPPGRIRPNLPPGLDLAVLKALAKDPAHRFNSAREFEHQLEAFLTFPDTIDHSIPEHKPKPKPAAALPPPPPSPPSPPPVYPAKLPVDVKQAVALRFNSVDALLLGAALAMVGALVLLTRV